MTDDIKQVNDVDPTFEHDLALLELIGKIDQNLDGGIEDVPSASRRLDDMLAALHSEPIGYIRKNDLDAIRRQEWPEISISQSGDWSVSVYTYPPYVQSGIDQLNVELSDAYEARDGLITENQELKNQIDALKSKATEREEFIEELAANMQSQKLRADANAAMLKSLQKEYDRLLNSRHDELVEVCYLGYGASITDDCSIESLVEQHEQERKL